MKITTILDHITATESAIKDPSTWTDERAALRQELKDMKEELRNAKKATPILLAIVKDLAFGAGPYDWKVGLARKLLWDHGLLTHDEYRLGGRDRDERYDHCFYDKNKVKFPEPRENP